MCGDGIQCFFLHKPPTAAGFLTGFFAGALGTLAGFAGAGLTGGAFLGDDGSSTFALG